MVAKKQKDKVKLVAQKRKIIGRKVKNLRKEGILPANIYGKKLKSRAVQVDLKDFNLAFNEAGETGIIELKLDKEDTARPVLIHNLQLDSVSDQPLHVDFYQVDLKEKVTAKIPVIMVGKSLAVEQKTGILIQPLAEVEVEALPSDLPEKMEIDIKSLEKIGDVISVVNLKAPAGVKILSSSDQILAKITPLAKEEVVTPAPAEAEAAAPAAETAAPAEAEAAAPAAETTVPAKPAAPAKKEKSAS